MTIVGVSLISNLVIAQLSDSELEQQSSDQELSIHDSSADLDGAASDLSVAETGAVGAGKAGAVITKGGFKKGAAAGK